MLLVGLIAFVVVDALTNKYVRSGTEDFLNWIEENPNGTKSTAGSDLRSLCLNLVCPRSVLQPEYSSLLEVR
jgi:hypothetical protein